MARSEFTKAERSELRELATAVYEAEAHGYLEELDEDFSRWRSGKMLSSFVVQTNWPNALNRPEESVDGGESTVAGLGGQVLFRLPRQASGVGIFTLGESGFDWHPQ